MGKPKPPGGFEQLVLLGLAACGERGSGRDIYERILEATGRDAAITAVHVTLARLERKGMVSSRYSEPDELPGNRSTKLYALTRAGAETLLEARDAFNALWRQAAAHSRFRQG